jgi:hypothetical protein
MQQEWWSNTHKHSETLFSELVLRTHLNARKI